MRKIKWTAYKRSGKWYSEGTARIKAGENYFDRDQLLADIASSQKELVPDAIIRREFFIAVDGGDDTPFINCLIAPKE